MLFRSAVKNVLRDRGVIDASLQIDLKRIETAGIPVDLIFDQGIETLGLTKFYKPLPEMKMQNGSKGKPGMGGPGQGGTGMGAPGQGGPGHGGPGMGGPGNGGPGMGAPGQPNLPNGQTPPPAPTPKK